MPSSFIFFCRFSARAYARASHATVSAHTHCRRHRGLTPENKRKKERGTVAAFLWQLFSSLLFSSLLLRSATHPETAHPGRRPPARHSLSAGTARGSSLRYISPTLSSVLCVFPAQAAFLPLAHVSFDHRAALAMHASAPQAGERRRRDSARAEVRRVAWPWAAKAVEAVEAARLIASSPPAAPSPCRCAPGTYVMDPYKEVRYVVPELDNVEVSGRAASSRHTASSRRSRPLLHQPPALALTPPAYAPFFSTTTAQAVRLLQGADGQGRDSLGGGRALRRQIGRVTISPRLSSLF